MPVDQNYSENVVLSGDFARTPIAVIDTAADYVQFLDATDGAVKRTLASAIGSGGGGGGGGGGGVTTYADAINQTITMTAAYDTLCSELCTMAVGDTVVLELNGVIYNDSGAGRTYRWQFSIGSLSTEVVPAVSLTNTTNYTPFFIRAVASVSATNLTRVTVLCGLAGPAPANSSTSTVGNNFRQSWNTTTSDLTGSNTVKLEMRSDTTAATQECIVHSWSINQAPSGTSGGGGGGGGGGTVNAGVATVDFGAFPGGSDASVTITGQTGIVAGSVVQAWLVAQPTADHTADEHRVETISVTCGNIVAGTGFTIYAQNTSQLNEPMSMSSPARFRSAAATVYGYQERSAGGRGTRIYGTWTVHWRWS